MAEIKWIKMSTELFDNRKIKQIECLPDGDGIIVIWVKLLCLAGSINDNGMVYFTKEIPYTEQMLASQFNRPLPLVQMALKVFEQFGMVDLVDNILLVSNWEKYQNVDGMEKIKEQTRKRVAKHRENQKLLASNATCNVTVTQCNATDIDKDIDIDKEEYIYNEPKRKRFTPPTIEDVKSYCIERNNNVDAERFIDYYTSNGWKVGKNPMKDWKSAVRTWERSGYNNTSVHNSNSNSTADFMAKLQSMYTE